jgi:hypothetical protein
VLKLCIVFGVPAALFSSLAAEKAFSSPSLASGRIFTLSFSAGVSKNRLVAVFYGMKTRSIFFNEGKNEAETGGSL